MSNDLEKLRRYYAVDFRSFAADCLKIRSKEKGIVPFVLNEAQLQLLNEFTRQMQLHGKVRFIILKARQMGFSTLIEAIIFWWTIFHPGTKSLVLTHLDSATKELFEMTRRYHQYTPEQLRPVAERNSANELGFSSIESAMKTATAGSKNVGHGSTIQCLHWSEVSRSRHQAEMTAGVMQTVPSGSGSMIFLESTANGINDYFFETWQAATRGENEYVPLFFPWSIMPEYQTDPTGFTFSQEEREYQQLYHLTDAQLAWRQQKIKQFEGSPEKKLALFREQYPITAEEAFQSSTESFIDGALVEKARKATYEPVGAVRIGIDPARKGRDSTGLIVRQGRKILKALRWKIPDTMLIAERCAKLINEFNADVVFVDTIGIGAGVFDRLKQLGFDDVLVEAVASERAEENQRYVNKRAEMWGRMEEWLAEGADIPDNDVLASDLLLPGFSFDGSERLKLQPKEQMKRSPDIADALAMTFYINHIRPRYQAEDEESHYVRRRTGGGSMINGRV